MKHEIKSKTAIGDNKYRFTILLKPDTDEEQSWIMDVENLKENQQVNDYLLFCAGDEFSPLVANPHGNNLFEVYFYKN